MNQLDFIWAQDPDGYIGKNGTMPPIPQGKNIVYSPERDKLLTACEGNGSPHQTGRVPQNDAYFC